LQLIASRTIPFVDSNSLEELSAREALFRGDDGRFFLYLTAGDISRGAEDRLVSLDPRYALLWINEDASSIASFWE
jgi:hypothetical protein